MRPAHQGEMLHKPHVYVTRKLANGTTVSGYEPAPEDVIAAQDNGKPTAEDLDTAIATAIAEQAAKDATTPKKAGWGNGKAAK